jgi:hypothetical protein
MSASEMNHLSEDLIIRLLDDELSSSERCEIELHLGRCEECQQKLASIRSFSFEVEAAIHAYQIPSFDGGRLELQRSIESRRPPIAVLRNPAGVMRRFGFGVGVAAMLALGVLLSQRHGWLINKSSSSPASQLISTAEQPSTIEVGGETFQAVPYSNPELPLFAPHIVQMQVPVSSLAEVGIVLEPVVDHAGSEGQASVLADVLVGPDGQPRGIHVLEFE